MWNALCHARSFALRPWWQRVPVAFGSRTSKVFDNTQLGAISVVIFLMLLPSLAQGRFLDDVFFDRTAVYAG